MMEIASANCRKIQILCSLIIMNDLKTLITMITVKQIVCDHTDENVLFSQFKLLLNVLSNTDSNSPFSSSGVFTLARIYTLIDTIEVNYKVGICPHMTVLMIT